MWLMIPRIHKKIHFYKKGERLKGSGQLQQNTEIMHVKVVFHAILTIFNFFLVKSFQNLKFRHCFLLEIRFDIIYFRNHHLIQSETHSLRCFFFHSNNVFFQAKQKKCWFFLPNVSLLSCFVFGFFKANRKLTLFYVASLF